MKIFIIAFFCLGACLFSQEYTVQAIDKGSYFQIMVQDVDDAPTIARLVITEMAVKAKRQNSRYIFLTIKSDPEGYSVKQMGKRQGKFYFDKGRNLPQIPAGQYNLYINKEFYGQLVVEKTNVYLLSPSVL